MKKYLVKIYRMPDEYIIVAANKTQAEDKVMQRYNRANYSVIHNVNIEEIELEEDENFCDKCHELDYSEDLIWITAFDFEPHKNEKIAPETYKKYNALCEDCYQSILI